MRCSSYCTAGSYSLEKNTKKLEKLGFKVKMIEKVLFAECDSTEADNIIKIFLFHFGCAIIWGGTEEDELSILNKLKIVEKKPLKEMHSEFTNYDYNDDEDRTFINEERNIIYLGNKSEIVKLSVSHALAQSVKLYELEESVIELLEKTEPIQKELAAKGSVTLSKSEISKQLGTLFNARYSINRHSDILDTPEFFWRRPSFEPIYLTTVEFQDILVRQEILNNHLNLIHEMYSMLASDLNHKHSTRLEVIIVLLIAIEVVLALYKENFFTKLIDLIL